MTEENKELGLQWKRRRRGFSRDHRGPSSICCSPGCLRAGLSMNLGDRAHVVLCPASVRGRGAPYCSFVTGWVSLLKSFWLWPFWQFYRQADGTKNCIWETRLILILILLFSQHLLLWSLLFLSLKKQPTNQIKTIRHCWWVLIFF